MTSDAARQEALDAEFRLDTITDLDALFARRAAATEAASKKFQARRGIPYGPGAAETLDFFPAAGGAGPAPVQLFIHGGFWSTLAAKDFSFVAEGFVPFGSALALIDYPLIPGVRLADIVDSCLRSIGFLHASAAELGIDPQRIHVSGNSAGGHLVAEVMDRARLSAAGLPTDVIKGGTAISGLYDLTNVAASFRNELLAITPDEIARFSPLKRPVDVGAPVIATVGGDETREFLDQTARYAAHCAAAGVPTGHLVVPDTNHITVVLDAFAAPEAPLNQATRAQMGLA